jgi:hypothetical protein
MDRYKAYPPPTNNALSYTGEHWIGKLISSFHAAEN